MMINSESFWEQIVHNNNKHNLTNLVIDYFDEEDLVTLATKALLPNVKTVVTNIKRNAVNLVYERIPALNPASVPAKFCFILYNRFKKFNGSRDKGLVVVIPFLFDEEIRKLEAFIIELAHFNYFDPAFIDWVEDCNSFSNIIY